MRWWVKNCDGDTNEELTSEFALHLQQKGRMKGLNLSLEFPQSSQKLVKPDLPRSLLSHASIPIHPMTQYLWKAEAPVPLHPVKSLHIDPTSLMLTVYLQYKRWSGGRGLSRKTHLLAGGSGTWADHRPPAQRRSTVGEGSTPALWCEGHDGWHFKSEEGQQAIQLKEARKQCHVSQITPKSLQLSAAAASGDHVTVTGSVCSKWQRRLKFHPPPFGVNRKAHTMSTHPFMMAEIKAAHAGGHVCSLASVCGRLFEQIVTIEETQT